LSWQKHIKSLNYLRMQLIATVPFLGKTCEVYFNPKSWSKMQFNGKYFEVNKTIGTNFDKLNIEFNSYCKNKLKNIIESQISRLRQKTVEVELIYTDGVKTFPKKIQTSVNKYLKEIGYSTIIDFEIGKYEKEWGINAINPKNKKFTLYFNQDLIKYDDGPNIEYVVAHELTHVFHRDHGEGFNTALQRLFPKKRTAEEFFKSGIATRFRLPNLSGGKNFNLVLIVLVAAILIYFIGQFLFGLIGNWFSNFGFGGSEVKF